MYATIEARVSHGRIIPTEPGKLPEKGRVLVVVMPPAEKAETWKECRKQAGWMKLDDDPVAWQRKIRSEWDNRV